jgi:orotidine-5'-phosphate decarboxylase
VSAKEKLIVALDVDNPDRAFELFEELRDSVGMFKIGMQLFTAAGPEIVRKIVASGSRVFLDLKYHDIPNTVSMAAIEATRLGVFLFNVHASGGREMLRRTADAVAETAQRENLVKPNVIGVTVLTSVDGETLHQLGIDEEPSSLVSRLAAISADCGLDGVVASAQEINVVRQSVPRSDFLIVTPGMRGQADASHDQKRVASVGDAIRAGADYVVVGRPIVAAEDRRAAAQRIVHEIESALTTVGTNAAFTR